MADTDVPTRCLPPAGEIWLELAREEKKYQFDEAVADQRRRIKLVDAKIREIIQGHRAFSPDHERK